MVEVWIVYRTWEYHHYTCRKVEGVVSTEELAYEFVEHISKTMDTKFGIDIQEWLLDDNFKENYERPY